MRLLTAILFFFAICGFLNCRENNSRDPELIRLMNSTDFFVRDTSQAWAKGFVRLASQYLALKSLENGFDSIQIRIWNGCTDDYRSGHYWLLALILKKDAWRGEYSDTYLEQSSISGRWDSLSRKTVERNPNSGWSRFITKLFNLHILVLPDFEKIKTDDDKKWSISDGCGIHFEIATNKIYRHYAYETPDFFKGHWQSQKIQEIIKFIEQEFDIKPTGLQFEK